VARLGNREGSAQLGNRAQLGSRTSWDETVLPFRATVGALRHLRALHLRACFNTEDLAPECFQLVHLMELRLNRQPATLGVRASPFLAAGSLSSEQVQGSDNARASLAVAPLLLGQRYGGAGAALAVLPVLFLPIAALTALASLTIKGAALSQSLRWTRAPCNVPAALGRVAAGV
jgi:hypothetical protein